MIKNGTFCVYNKEEYILNEDMEGNTIILTSDVKKIDSSFVDKYNSGVYSKVVIKTTLDAMYTVRTFGRLNDCKVNIEKEQDDCYLVGTSDCKVAEKLNLQRSDKYYYEGKIEKDKVEIIIEKRDLC